MSSWTVIVVSIIFIFPPNSHDPPRSIAPNLYTHRTLLNILRRLSLNLPMRLTNLQETFEHCPKIFAIRCHSPGSVTKRNIYFTVFLNKSRKQKSLVRLRHSKTGTCLNYVHFFELHSLQTSLAINSR